MEQMAKYYWGMLTAAAGSSSPRSYWPPPAHATAAGEPSWEELAFARDAGHLGGCVWPPRSYTCTFCRREFRSAQALGGHMNVHRRDRARLRQCASPDHDDDAHKQESLIDVAPPADHHQLLQLQESPLFRAKAAAVPISGPKSTCCDHQIYSKAKDHHQEAVITTAATSSSYISSIVKESKLVISIPAATIDEEDCEVIVAAERRKRRRVHQKQPEALLPLFFLRPQLASSKSGVEHDAKVPKVITSPSSPNTLHSNLSGRQEVDLELRLALKK